MWQPMIQDEDKDFPLTCVLLCAGKQIQGQKEGGEGNDISATTYLFEFIILFRTSNRL